MKTELKLSSAEGAMANLLLLITDLVLEDENISEQRMVKLIERSRGYVNEHYERCEEIDELQ
jgi:hypothetical protein